MPARGRSIPRCTGSRYEVSSGREMTASENNRRARVYAITAAGLRRLKVEQRAGNTSRSRCVASPRRLAVLSCES